MALLNITCEHCGHGFYRIVVACNSEGVDTTCPACGGVEGNIHVMKTGDGTSPFAPCSHVNDDAGPASAQVSDETTTQSHHAHASTDRA